MDNQHRKIKGYRELNETEIYMMNELKVAEATLLHILDTVKSMPNIDARWLSIGRTHIEQGFMAAIRSIARPNSEETEHVK